MILSADVVSIGAILPGPEVQLVDLPPETGLDPIPAYQCEKKIGAGLISPGRMRRLGRTQKLLVAASKLALADLEIPLEDIAVCVGSGAGESDETVKFLRNMIEHHGDQPMPSRFVNSVPSSLSTQIAIEFGMRGENFMFTHHSISFELGLWQALMLLANERAPFVLAAGGDAIEPDLLAVCHDYGWWREEGPELRPLEETQPQSGSIPGEGAASMLLAPADSQGEKRLAKIAGLSTRPTAQRSPSQNDPAEEADFILEFLSRLGVSPDDLSLVVVGANGAGQLDETYKRVLKSIQEKTSAFTPVAVYKHRIGEFCSAAAVAYRNAIQTIADKNLSDALSIVGEGEYRHSPAKSILLYNIHSPGYHSVGIVSP